MTTRGDVVTVLDGFTIDLGDGQAAVVVAYERPPDSLQAFNAWPVWVATTWRTACIDETTWQVLVALPGGVPDAWAAHGDAVRNPIRDQLSKVGGVMRCEPVAIPSGDASTVPALAFTLVV